VSISGSVVPRLVRNGKLRKGEAKPPERQTKILLAIDASKCSEAATQAIVHRIKAQDAEVHVFTVVDLLDHFPEEQLDSKNSPKLNELRLARLHIASELVERAAQLLRHAGFKASVGVAEGNPTARIIEEAEQWKADLIVVGSHGRRRFERALMGSVSEGVARYAPCSVEVVRTRQQRP